MAIYNLPNYKDSDGLGFPKNFRRGNPNPLDNSYLWSSYEDALNYAKTDSTAYVGQELAVVEFDENSKPIASTLYQIQDEAGTLKRVGTVTLGDDETIIKNADDTLSIKGFAEAANGAQLVKSADGVLSWVVPSTDTVEGLQTNVKNLMDTVNGTDTTDGLVDRVAANEDAIETLNADSTTEGSVAYQIAAIINGANASYDTLKEVADWIATHGTDAATMNTSIKNNSDAIDDLKELVGSDSVADQIADAVDAALKSEGADKYALAADLTALAGRVTTAEGKLTTLTGEESVVGSVKATAKSYADGAVSTAKSYADETFALKDHSHEIGKVTGLQDALDGKADKANTLAGYGITDAMTATAIAGAISTAKDEAIASAGTGTTNALNNKIGEIGTGTVKDYVDNAVSGVSTDVSDLEDRVAANEDAIEIINGANTVEGSIKKAAADAVASANAHTESYAAAKTHIHEIAQVNGLQDELDAKATNATVNGISEQVTALGNKIGTTSVADQIAAQAEADAAKYTTKTELSEHVEASNTAIAEAKQAGTDAQNEVDALEEYVGTIPTDSTAKSIIEYINEKATSSGNDIEDLGEQVTANKNAIAKLNGGVSDEGSVAKIANDAAATAVANVVNGAPEAFDTLKEISDWIGEGNTSAADMITSIGNNTDAIAKLNGDADTEGSVANAISNLESSIDEKLEGKVDAVEGKGLSSNDYDAAAVAQVAKIAGLESASHSHDNQDVLDGIDADKVAAWDAAEANAKKADEKVVIKPVTFTANPEGTTFTVALTPDTNYKLVADSYAKVVVNGVDYVVLAGESVTVDAGFGLDEDDEVYVEFREILK